MIKQFSIVDQTCSSYTGINIYIETDDNHRADFSIRYKYLGNSEVAPKLELFDDCWYVLFHYCQDLLVRLAEVDNTQPTIAQLAEILVSLGYKKE